MLGMMARMVFEVADHTLSCGFPVLSWRVNSAVRYPPRAEVDTAVLSSMESTM